MSRMMHYTKITKLTPWVLLDFSLSNQKFGYSPNFSSPRGRRTISAGNHSLVFRKSLTSARNEDRLPFPRDTNRTRPVREEKGTQLITYQNESRQPWITRK